MDACEKIPVLALVGPTASGKTALAVRLAQRYNAEVISCDSMQIYRDLSVSTARPQEHEMQGVPHHLLGFLSADEAFSAADFCRKAAECVRDIRSRGKNVIFCGGTGLYVQSFLENIEFTGDGADPEFRYRMNLTAQVLGNRAVWALLAAVDPQAADELHPNNRGRVIRALEINRTQGHTLHEQRALSRRNVSPYRSLTICLDFADRQTLYDRINERVEIMLRHGLEAEARAFYSRYGGAEGTAHQAIGCKEFLPYFRGEITYDAAVEQIKRQTRRYAKRQLTWFRRMPDIRYIYADREDAFESAVRMIESEGIFPSERRE